MTETTPNADRCDFTMTVDQADKPLRCALPRDHEGPHEPAEQE